jgi:DNA helicase HerA-like ATPase
MTEFFEQLIADLWNRMVARRAEKKLRGPGLELGNLVVDGSVSTKRVVLPDQLRPQHVTSLGRTGMGKSTEMRRAAFQNIREQTGFIWFDLHSEEAPELLRFIALEEERLGVDLSDRVIVIDPSDPEYSVGLNILESGGNSDFVRIGEFTRVLKERWGLDYLGARTEELLRNTLVVLSDNGFTILEIALLLTNPEFLSSCLPQVKNPEVRAYFEDRYLRLSDAQQTVFREAILNKVSAFTADPHFRHILGQQHSTFSLESAFDRAYFVILWTDKGKCGEEAITLDALFLTLTKNAQFARQSRKLFSIYLDEVQNFISGNDLETLYAESRKFGVSVTCATQFLEQCPPAVRAAILSANTQMFFRLTAPDADKVAAALDGGRNLAELLKNLPQRNMVVKIGERPWVQAEVPNVAKLQNDFSDLYRRSRNRWARKRTEVESEIQSRHARARAMAGSSGELHDWE